jgi:acetyltransferase EpsM
VASSEQPLLIIGNRTFAAEVADLVSEIPGFKVVGFVESLDPARCQGTLEGLPILWVDELTGLRETHCAVFGLGTTQSSLFAEQLAPFGIRFATLVHPSARISSTSSLGEGTLASVGAIVAAHTHIGRHVIINRGALIGHHTEIGDFTAIGPGANIAGNCRIGAATYIGMGAVVIDHLTIGTHAVIGAGSVVTKDVPDRVLVVGVPARIVKENIAGK